MIRLHWAAAQALPLRRIPACGDRPARVPQV